MKVVKLILAFVFAVSMALPVMGQEPTEDVTGAPFEVVATAEATEIDEAPGDTDVVVEDGGTVIIENGDADKEPAGESDVSIVAKLTAGVILILGLLRAGLAALKLVLDKISANQFVMTGGEYVTHKLPQAGRDQIQGAMNDARDVGQKAWAILSEWLDDEPVLKKKLLEKMAEEQRQKPIAPVATADSKPSFPPPSNSEPQG